MTTVIVRPVRVRAVVVPQVGVVRRVGVQGPMGPAGGVGSDKTYVHTQNVPSTTWVIDHNLGKFPSLFIEDSVGDEIEGSVVHGSVNQTTVTFSAATGGRAICN